MTWRPSHPAAVPAPAFGRGRSLQCQRSSPKSPTQCPYFTRVSSVTPRSSNPVMTDPDQPTETTLTDATLATLERRAPQATPAPQPGVTAELGNTDLSPYRTTTERPAHLQDWHLPREWAWGTDGVWIGHHRHTQQVIDPLGRTLSLVTAPDEAHWDWLTAEARLLGNRRHKVIPTTYVYWPRNEVAPRGPGYVRHWIDGVSLAMQLQSHGPDSIEQAMTRLRSIGACLAMLHDRGETHGSLNGQASWMSRMGEHYLVGWHWALPPAALPEGKLPSLQWTVAAPEWRDEVAAGGMWWRPTPATDQFQLGALTIAALTGNIEVRFADTTLIDAATDNTPLELAFAYTIDTDKLLTFTAHEVYLPKPKLAISGPGGVQATFDWQAAKATSPARMLTVVLKNDVASYA